MSYLFQLFSIESRTNLKQNLKVHLQHLEIYFAIIFTEQRFWT